MRGPKSYDEGGGSAAAPPAGAPPYCIETGRARLPGNRDQEVSPTSRGECLVMSEPPPIAEYLAETVFRLARVPTVQQPPDLPFGVGGALRRLRSDSRWTSPG